MIDRLVLAFALFLIPVTAAGAAPPSSNPDPYSPDRTRVAFTDDRARKFLDEFARCIASRQPRKAVAMLALSYGSGEQQRVALDLGTSEIECMGPYTGELSMSLDGSSLAAGMAEYLVTHANKIEDMRRREPNSFIYAEPTAVERFGECVVEQDPAGVTALARSDIASIAESVATDALIPEIQQCVTTGQTLSLDRTALRQLLMVSLYKHVAIPPPAVPATAASTQH